MGVEQSELSKTNPSIKPVKELSADKTSEPKIPNVGVEIRKSVQELGPTQNKKSYTKKEYNAAIAKVKVEEYNRGMVDTLKGARDIRTGLMKAGEDLVRKHNAGIELTAKEIAILKIIMESVGKVEEKFIKRAEKDLGSGNTFNIVNFIAGNAEPELVLEAEID